MELYWVEWYPNGIRETLIERDGVKMANKPRPHRPIKARFRKPEPSSTSRHDDPTRIPPLKTVDPVEWAGFMSGVAAYIDKRLMTAIHAQPYDETGWATAQITYWQSVKKFLSQLDYMATRNNG